VNALFVLSVKQNHDQESYEIREAAFLLFLTSSRIVKHSNVAYMSYRQQYYSFRRADRTTVGVAYFGRPDITTRLRLLQVDSKAASKKQSRSQHLSNRHKAASWLEPTSNIFKPFDSKNPSLFTMIWIQRYERWQSCEAVVRHSGAIKSVSIHLTVSQVLIDSD
jgi:hypothetical protein